MKSIAAALARISGRMEDVEPLLAHVRRIGDHHVERLIDGGEDVAQGRLCGEAVDGAVRPGEGERVLVY